MYEDNEQFNIEPQYSNGCSIENMEKILMVLSTINLLLLYDKDFLDKHCTSKNTFCY